MLPKELWTIILLNSRVKDFPNIVLTCKMFNKIIHDKFFQNRWISNDYKLNKTREMRKGYIIIPKLSHHTKYAFLDPPHTMLIKSINVSNWPIMVTYIRLHRCYKCVDRYTIGGKCLYSSEESTFICRHEYMKIDM